AIKYTPGEGKITVTAEVQGDYVQASITDTGLGIPPEDRERIFERFAQVEGSTSRTGFGLGLSFCRLAVEAHGGQIWVESGDDGAGSRFTFTLPLEKPPEI
ncbi:sensor histidine kinase, partial [Chloroflexota bacterium]